MCLSVAVRNPHLVLAKGQHAEFEWNVVQNGMGCRCGYVKVTEKHPWFGMDYNDVPADVHGGLTFGEPDVHCGKGGPDNGFWFGFDCAHAGDRADPALPGCDRLSWLSGVVRTQEYVEAECRSLCEQAAAAR